MRSLAAVLLVCLAAACGGAEATEGGAVDPYDDPRLILEDDDVYTWVGPATTPSYRFPIPPGWELRPATDAAEVRLGTLTTSHGALSVVRTAPERPLAEMPAATVAASVAGGARRELLGAAERIVLDGAEGISFDALDTSADPARRVRTVVVDYAEVRFVMAFAADDGDAFRLDALVFEDLVLGEWRWVDYRDAPAGPT